jgi:hypothetical protein
MGIYFVILLRVSTETSRLVSLRLPESDYSKLQHQAAALGLKPAVLARVIVRTGLSAPGEAGRHSRRSREAALARLSRHAARGKLPTVDAVELIKAVRKERDEQIVRASVRSTSGE